MDLFVTNLIGEIFLLRSISTEEQFELWVDPGTRGGGGAAAERSKALHW